jgi:hypothetical protein
VSDILNQFREEELPMSTVDVSRAMQTGRRRRRTMTIIAAAATVTVLVAGAVAGSALLSKRSALPPADPSCGSPAPARPSMPTWEHFDPLVYEIDASGVQGYRATVTSTATNWQTLGLVNASGNRTVELNIYSCAGSARSMADDSAPANPTEGEPADPVHGAQAYWLPPNQSASHVALAWQWAPGAWAILTSGGVESSPPAAELRSIAAQVAQQLRFGAGTPVTSPFSVPMPDGTYPAMTLRMVAHVEGQQPRGGFFFGFEALGTAAPPHYSGYVPYLWVNASQLQTIDQLPAGATPYPENLGFPAYRSDLRSEGRDSDLLLVYDWFGFGVEIEPRGMTGTRDEKLSYAADTFRSMTVYSGADKDMSVWGNPIAP